MSRHGSREPNPVPRTAPPRSPSPSSRSNHMRRRATCCELLPLARVIVATYGEPMDTIGGDRDAYLIGGRRVVIADIVRAGMLSSGDKLVFQRKRLRESSFAVITQDHQISLDDGRLFRSPSGAATAVAGTQIDG